MHTPFYSRRVERRKVVELGERPGGLPDGSTVTERAWKRYQAYLNRVSPIDRADFYARLRERGFGSVRAMAQVTGEDWSRVARLLKLLELPGSVLGYLRTHKDPATVAAFSERRLRELLALGDPARIEERFAGLLAEGGLTELAE